MCGKRESTKMRARHEERAERRKRRNHAEKQQMSCISQSCIKINQSKNYTSALMTSFSKKKKKEQTFIDIQFRRQKAFLRAGRDQEEEEARTSRESRKRSSCRSGEDSSQFFGLLSSCIL